MRTVKIRDGYEVVDGKIIYNETGITYAKAEKLCGIKLDKRRGYRIIDGELCSLANWTSPCTGCSPDDPYWTGNRGGGCSECGGSGKRRHGGWVPVISDGKIVVMKKEKKNDKTIP